jgi:hypothetical protein
MLWKKNAASLLLRWRIAEATMSTRTVERGHAREVAYSAMSGQAEIFQRQHDGNYAVYGDDGGSYGKHKSISSVLRGRVDTLPDDAVPASLGPRRKYGRQRVTLRTRASNQLSQEDDTVLSFASYVRSQDNHIQNTLQFADLSDGCADAVAKQILSDLPIFGGTDGGLLEGWGTFGYAWADYSSSHIVAMGKGQVPGHTHVMLSTRAELCGIFAALIYMQLVTTYHHIVPCRARKLCTMYCDSKAALQRISDLSYDGFGTT